MSTPIRKTEPEMATVRYEADPYGWSKEQAMLLRTGRLSEIDVMNVAEEIEDVGGRHYDKLESALTILLMHMLKWEFQPAFRGRSWEATIREQRLRVRDRLEDNPSLKSKLEQAIRRAYRYGRAHASGETGLELAVFPVDCPYSWADIIEREFELGKAKS